MSSVPKSKRKCSDNHNAMDLAQDIRATLNLYDAYLKSRIDSSWKPQVKEYVWIYYF